MDLREWRSTTIYFCLWLAMALSLWFFRQVLLPIGAALLIAYVIAPLVARLSRIRVAGRQIPRGVSVIAIYAGFFLLIYGFVIIAVPQLYREAVRLSEEARELAASFTPERVAELTRSAEQWLARQGFSVSLGDPAAIAQEGQAPARLQVDLQAAVKNLFTDASRWVRSHVLDIVSLSQKVVGHVVGSVFNLFFVLMIAAFLLLDTDGILAFFRDLVPKRRRVDFDSLLTRIDEKLAGVVRGQIIICLVNGVLTLIGLLLLEVKFAFILATIATVLSFIPIFGTIVSTIPIVLVGLSQSFSTAVAALAWVLGIHALEAYLLNPKIMGSAAKIHPALVAVSILAAERTFGFAGALFAVPVASIGIATFNHFHAKAKGLVGDPPAVEVAQAAEETTLSTEEG